MRESLDVDLEENLCKSETEAGDLDAADSQESDQNTAQLSVRRPPSTNKPHLHGLRGLAALVVYIGHRKSLTKPAPVRQESCAGAAERGFMCNIVSASGHCARLLLSQSNRFFLFPRVRLTRVS